MNINTIINSASLTPVEKLRKQARDALSNALHAHRTGQKVYKSLKNLGEVIGTEYGDRVLFELIQNAHDAHKEGSTGRIAIKLASSSKTEGYLVVANRGQGFRDEDIDAIINLATSSKEIGEGIGNKGLGFRSIEAITDDVHIYSRSSDSSSKAFDGYCFRFAKSDEIKEIMRRELNSEGVTEEEIDKVYNSIPRYLVPQPLEEVHPQVQSYAKNGYATVIFIPLKSESAIKLVNRQIKIIANSKSPLLLFLDRISSISIDIEKKDKVKLKRRLTRSEKIQFEENDSSTPKISIVDVGMKHKFLMLKQYVNKDRVIASVKDSITRASPIKRWLNWKGEPSVAIAVSLSKSESYDGQLYNFLPMGKEARSPLSGHIDAPFYATIDRRDVDLGLPLNSVLMDVSAEACVLGALTIIQEKIDVPQYSVFDLIAWTGDHADILSKASESYDFEQKDLPVIPITETESGEKWSTIDGVTIWPNVDFSILKQNEVVKHVDIHIASCELDPSRQDRLRAMAQHCFEESGEWFHSRLPSPNEVPEWMEKYAKSLVMRNVKPLTWVRFYKDIVRLCDHSGVELTTLHGAKILVDASGQLRPAGGHDDDYSRGVYVRRRSVTGNNKKKDLSFPPSSLARKYRFLDPKVNLPQGTLETFITADMIRIFDPIVALGEINSVLGKSPRDARRFEALEWTFHVWSSIGEDAESTISTLDLYVPTIGGWKQASQSTFSGSWTKIGKRLEEYLSGASSHSTDCENARKQLIIPFDKWNIQSNIDIKKWTKFLSVLGVNDGLKLCSSGDHFGVTTSSWYWKNLFRNGDSNSGLGELWTNCIGDIDFRFPNVNEYTLEQELWRIPGQDEYNQLPDHIRATLYELIVHHISKCKDDFLHTRLGRFMRKDPTSIDEHRIVTPAGAFVISQKWIIGELRGDQIFLSPRECWASSNRRQEHQVPPFLPRLPSDAKDLIESEEVAKVLFGDALGLLDWSSENTASNRLVALANVVQDLHPSEIATFRRHYSRAWIDLSKSDIDQKFPSNASLAVNRHGKIERIHGNNLHPVPITLVDSSHSQGFEARILSKMGSAVLDVRGGDLQFIQQCLQSTSIYSPRMLDPDSIRLLVDNAVFAHDPNDESLDSLGLDWLPEVAIIANDLLGEGIERGVQRTSIDSGIRKIRVRRCHSISLSLFGEEVIDGNRIDWYAYPDPEHPTLIIKTHINVDWACLGKHLSGEISRLVDTRLRSLENALAKLALTVDDRFSVPSRPSDSELADALQCDIEVINDYLAEMRTDLISVAYLLIPVVAYYLDVNSAKELEKQIQLSESGFDLSKWLEEHFSNLDINLSNLISVCSTASDRRHVVKELKLDYGKFNRALQSLGQNPLSSETRFRSMFEAYLREESHKYRHQIRKVHLDDYKRKSNLSKYLSRRSLKFVTYNQDWVLDHEDLDRNIVSKHIKHAVEFELGQVPDVEIPPYEETIKANRKTLRRFIVEARPVVNTWCQLNDAELPNLWQSDDNQEIARLIEDTGFLDFEPIHVDCFSSLFLRTGIWPLGMPSTIELEKLGIQKGAVENELARKLQERTERDRQSRMIQFLGAELDSGDPSNFATSMESIAEDLLASDSSWLERSRSQTRLVSVNESGASRLSGIPNKEPNRNQRTKRLPEAQRIVMGLTGEWLAFQYLKEKFPNAVDEDSWISKNRRYFFGGGEGDDSAGYDFLVRTPEADRMFEVKSTQEDGCEFEMTSNELRVASSFTGTGRRRYRILYVPYVFSPDKWCVLELPNPMDRKKQNQFSVVGRGSLRLRFTRQ